MATPRPPTPAPGSNPAQPVWSVGSGKRLDLSRPRILAILNCTPDSFSDGGLHLKLEDALAAAARAVTDGADALDIGGESTRPGAGRVPATEQIARTVPVIRALRAASGQLAQVPITIDTTLAEVAEAALNAGADGINDVSAGTEDDRLLPLAAARGAGLILMHRLRPPGEDEYSDRYPAPPAYGDVVREVGSFLAGRAAAALAAGVARESIILDPGLGFGKSVEQNLELIRRTPELLQLGYPVLSASSRKSFVGVASGLRESRPVDRVAGSVAFSVMHYHLGARVFRVHDVREHAEALRAAHRIATGASAGA